MTQKYSVETGTPRPEFRSPDEAFEDAIKSGVLDRDAAAANSVAQYTYLYTRDGFDYFRRRVGSAFVVSRFQPQRRRKRWPIRFTELPAADDGRPGLFLIDVPFGARASNLLLGRYDYMVYETRAERAALFDALTAAEIWTPIAELVDQNHGAAATRSYHDLEPIMFVTPAGEWPHVLLIAWPEGKTELADLAQARPLARGTYSIETSTMTDVLVEQVRVARALAPSPAGIAGLTEIRLGRTF